MSSARRHLRAVPLGEVIGDMADEWEWPEPACGWDEWDRQVRANDAAAAAPPPLGRRCELAQVPLRVKQDLLGEIRETKALRDLDAAMAAGTECAVLFGGTGCGKTVAACHWLTSEQSGRYVHNHETQVMRWRAGMFMPASTYVAIGSFDKDAIDQVVRAPLLVLDDLAQEFADRRGYGAQRIDDLIARRHEAKRPTVVTANKGRAEIERIYGPRLISRLSQCAVWISLKNEPDLRQEKR